MTTAATARFAVDPWDPGYASLAEVAVAEPAEESAAPLNLDLEMPAAQWRPVPPRGPAAPCVVFVDGVRRIDARVWFLGTSGASEPGIAASYAAGVVVCDGSANVSDITVERGLFSASAAAVDVRTPCGELFQARMAANAELATLSGAVQERMRAIEIDAAMSARSRLASRDDDLLVVDGPLRGRENLPRAIGYVKTHQASYLPAEQHAVVAALASGERTPVFTLGTHWSRHTWYLRLPGPVPHPWAGVVRCECSSALAPVAAIELADVTAATLPAFASSGHKDGRAPQNLYPIGGLERALRHRLGDRRYVYRELGRAAAAG